MLYWRLSELSRALSLWSVPSECLVWWALVILYNNHSLKQEIEHPKGIVLGEGNGNPLQCSCLENPRDGGAWWAAVYGVTQSRTWLKWLSSKGIVKFTGMSLQQNKLPNKFKFISCSLFLIFFLVFIVLHLISLRLESSQRCQVDNLPSRVFHVSPVCWFLPSVDLKQIDCQILFQQRWAYSESAENGRLRSAFVESQV